MKKIKCPNCEEKIIIYPKCEHCKKDIKRGVGLLNMYVQSPTNKYQGSGRYWREWTKCRLCPSCYKKAIVKLKEIFGFIASSK